VFHGNGVGLAQRQLLEKIFPFVVGRGACRESGRLIAQDDGCACDRLVRIVRDDTQNTGVGGLRERSARKQVHD